MPGVDLEKVYADPDFQALGDDDKRSVLQELGYTDTSGGPEAKLSQGEPENLWDRARTAVSNAIFGTPEREEAKAAGIGVDMTPADLVKGAAFIASPMASPAAAAEIPGAVGAVARAALPFLPKAYGAAMGGQQGYRRGGVLGGVGGAVAGAMKPVGTGAVSGAVDGFETGGVPGALIGGATGALMGSSDKGAAIAATKDKLSRVAQLLKTAEGTVKPGPVGQAVKAIASGAAAAPKASVQAAMPLADRMKESVLMWKNQNKLSGAQIQRFIRETYGKEVEGGMTMSQAGKIRDMILGGS